MRGFVIAMASLAFIGGLSQGGTEPIDRPKPQPAVVQPFNPTTLPPIEPAKVAVSDCKPAVGSTDPLTGIHVTSPTVIMVSASWCGPCKGFKRGPMPGELVAKGWAFLPIDVDDPSGQWSHIKVASYPTYLIYDNKRWVKVTGVLTAARMKAALGIKPVSEPLSYQGTPQTKYTPRWQNFDGKTRMQHAVEDHGIDIRGKSEAQVLREMDAYHDQYGGGHSIARLAPMKSSCPTCPTSRGFFARR